MAARAHYTAPMRLTTIGAAGEVTGSATLLETGAARILVDCGLFQGHRHDAERNRDPFPFDPRSLDAVVLTHAHLDHAGRTPLLAERGYEGAVHGTAATIELAELLLRDSAHIQMSDAKRRSRKRAERGLPEIEPLYDLEAVEALVPSMVGHRYGHWSRLADGVRARYHEAGHILGSSSVELECETRQGLRTILFSGDVGSPGRPILRDPAPPAQADIVVCEATYGDRDHRSYADTLTELEELLLEALRGKRKVLVPVFAVGRTQELLYHLATLFREGRVPAMPVVLDSPLASRATAVYRAHEEVYDDEACRLARTIERDLHTLEVTASPDDSKALNYRQGPLVILAGSGMCNGGRILHHLRQGLPHQEVDVVFVGYQAQGTLGRRLIDRPRRVRVLGSDVQVNARIHSLGGLSAHAGRSELLDWLDPFARAGARIVLNHGEPGPRASLADALEERTGALALLPGPGDRLEL